MSHFVQTDMAKWRVIDDEAVLINIETGHYYSLNKTGTRAWLLLIDKGLSAEELTKKMASSYGATEDAIRNDIHKILKDLLNEGLLKKE